MRYPAGSISTVSMVKRLRPEIIAGPAESLRCQFRMPGAATVSLSGTESRRQEAGIASLNSSSMPQVE